MFYQMTQDMIQDIARVCHEANRAYCLTLGDESHVSWDDAPEWQRDSAMNGVAFLMRLDRDEDPCALAQSSHANWLEQKTKEGWVYGAVKDVEKKEHPCCVPYADLPPDQRKKDAIFSAIVNAMRPGLTQELTKEL
jgi:hypothetical protein